MKANRARALGHIAAITSITIWGVTFTSTKILLLEFSPTEILFFRFLFAFALLFIMAPRPTRPSSLRIEGFYAIAGLTGVVAYFLLQNIGLQYTLASNAGILVSVAPMFTAIVAMLFGKGNSITRRFIVGFFIAIVGVALVSFNGAFMLKLSPKGDIMILLAALSWAIYSNLMTFSEKAGLSLVRSTRKVFFYGLLLMIPVVIISNASLDLSRFSDPVLLGNMAFLGLMASGMGFLTWNYAINVLGSVRTSVYIYLVPIVTIAVSIVVLDERITWISGLGTVLILTGLFLSERKSRARALRKS